MRISAAIFVVSVMSGACACAAMAQKPDFPFKPGQWKINITLVLDNGKPLNSQMQVCATKPEDAWKQASRGQTCDPIKFTHVSGGGVEIQTHCKGGNGQMVTEMSVDTMAHFASNGESYTETGTSTATTTMPGRPPMVRKIQMEGSGAWLGSCTPQANP